MSELPAFDFSVLDQVDNPGVSYKAGETIVSDGAPATEMYLLRSGRVSIKVKGKTVEEIGAGGIFGEMALIGDSARSAGVIATEDSVVIPVDQRLFLILIQETPNFALDVLRVLSRRLRKLNENI